MTADIDRLAGELPDDPEALDLLDDYLRRLHAGERPDRSELVRKRPDLQSALRCLEALEGLAAVSEEHARSETDESIDLCISDLPRAFGPYELLDEIGRGGMGVVYRARQKALDRIVAVKMILGSQIASPEHIRRFHIEARAAARLQHSNIVHIHDVGHVHGQNYFAMEYIEGESLSQRLARGPINVATAIRLVATVARAVDHLHKQNVVHRDLKPSNILLDAQQRPYVTDFGLAKMFGPGTEATTTGVVAGTFSYMAPEQANGRDGPIGPAVDIYSLGAILYEVLTGQPPFREESPLDTWMAVIGSEPPAPRDINPKVPAGLELICLKCLAKSAEDRYASAGALADDLERFARGEALEVRPPRLTQRLGSWARRQPALAMRLAGLSVFWIVEWVNYFVESLDPWFHLKVLSILAAWAAVAIVCQQFLETGRNTMRARLLWGLLDSLLLFAILLVADGVASPLIIGYPLLIICSGLWFRVRFVWFVTGLSLISYGIHMADFYLRRDALRERFPQLHFDRHVIFLVALCLMSAGVGYLVHRVRTLSSFYGRQVP